MWTQIVGKIRLVQLPWINPPWHVPVYVTSRGLTTSSIPYESRAFEVGYDLMDHKLLIQTSSGEAREVALVARSVADFYQDQ
jgi:hypothetical protein